MIHFPELEPAVEELDDPQLFVRLSDNVQQKITNLSDATEFEVRIIDFGLSCRLEEGE